MGDFTELFDQWAVDYDRTVYGIDNEYKEVFERYDHILSTVCDQLQDKKGGVVLEIGVGTGNLTSILYKRGFHVIPIEPSQEMRKIAKNKLSHIEIYDGHFLNIHISTKVDAIVTSYAFHHLDQKEKREAIYYLDSFLKEGGKVVIADTMFESKKYKKALYKEVENEKKLHLLNDLNTEYYEYIEDISKIFEDLDYRMDRKKMNKYVWIMTCYKGGNKK
ncbi:class I SAM-dependent methyltransferase [Anaerophilus nitritogenes]|uniref:class I SAM-dependent methyltransferase n=1 Tax=Anaerophilus nitritogenes TaxID=2498136 RepID=UPI00101DC4EF|nr:class I SAM-dependent methyltransferase [Anaerophilus nitritogenes]